MLLPMGVLSLLTLLLGFASSFVLSGLTGIVASIGLTSPVTLRFPFLEIVATRHAFADVLPLARVAVLLALVFGLVVLAVRFMARETNCCDWSDLGLWFSAFRAE